MKRNISLFTNIDSSDLKYVLYVLADLQQNSTEVGVRSSKIRSPIFLSNKEVEKEKKNQFQVGYRNELKTIIHLN